MRANINNRDYEQLSAYIDGQLVAGEQRRLEERLQSRPDLQQALEDLRRTKALIRMAPRRQAPRNFTLTPAMVGERARPRRGAGFFTGLFPTLSFASAVATIILVATVLFELSPAAPLLTAQVPGADRNAMEQESAAPESVLRKSTGGTQATEPAAGIMSMPEEPSVAADSAEGGVAGAAPPVYNWGIDGIGGGAAEAAPACPGGMCGGAPDIYFGKGGGGGGGGGSAWATGGGAPDGTIMVPPQSVESLKDAEVPAQEPSEVVKPDPSISGSGPVLGVPEAGQGGQVIGSQAVGQGIPLEQVKAPVEREPEAVQEEGPASGITTLRIVQIALAVIAVFTGAAALIVRRRTAR